ncbi:uncharacterized protein [Mytilus edulis]|uniref:uncharacterized protein n=1 Tax=Mytilus edulis TaxID=6550 RepID=UPI0039F0BF65
METKKYVDKLPCKEEHHTLLDNRSIESRRTENVIKRLNRELTLLQKNGKIINEQEKRRFIERVDERSAKTNVHSIPPHHFRKKSSTTPIRIVFDCSCKPSPINLSLNDCLMDLWPNFNDLTGIFLRFRMHKYAVSTGIEKALLIMGWMKRIVMLPDSLMRSNPDDPNSQLTANRFKSV